MYWWAYPSRIALFILIPIYLGCAWSGDDAYILFYKQSTNYITGEEFWLGLIGLAAFALGAWCFEPRTLRHPPQRYIDVQSFNKVLLILYGVALTAYAIFLLPAFTHLNLVIALATGSTMAMYELRNTLNSIAGITSFVSLQSLCVVLHLGYKRFTGHPAPHKYRYLLYCLIAGCILRAWLWSERIAVLELAMPMLLITFLNPWTKRKQWLSFAPLFGMIAVFGLFSLGEYFRTWQYYQTTWHGSYLEFTWIRFIGYFATALNNGAIFYHTVGTAYVPTNTALWFYKLPLWSPLGITFDADIAYDKPSIIALLGVYGNIEYNNPSGIFMPFCDFGPILGALCWMLLGIISGLLCKAFFNSQTFGLVFFPVWYFGILEILRIFYWGDSRFFPALVTSLLVSAYLSKHRNRNVIPAAPQHPVTA